MGSKVETALARFSEGFACSSSVLMAFCEDYDIEPEKAGMLSCGLGGGCSSGEVCGAVTGACIVIGLKYGQGIAGDTGAKANCKGHVTQFIEKFKESNGALRCNDLLGCDITTEEGFNVYLEKRGTVCPAVVKSSASILEELEY